MGILSLSVYVLLLATVLHAKPPSITISPKKTFIMVMQGDRLQIDCIQEYVKKGSDESAFEKNGQTIIENNTSGYMLKSQSRFVAEPAPGYYIHNLSLSKDQVESMDQGKFVCYVGSESSRNESDIFVGVVQVSTRGEELPPSGKEDKVELLCTLEDTLPPKINNVNVEKTFIWARNGKDLEDGDKYKTFQNGSLFIMNAERADMGEYQCSVIFFPEDDKNRHRMTPKSAFLKAAPKIDQHDNNKNMVQGDKLELKCDVSGEPTPTVTWFKDNIELNGTTRIHFLEYKKSSTGLLQIFDLDYADEGDYTCYANNSVNPYNATATMKLRVKDKLAALWPFLGIVAEVVVLCVIILVYEKRRSKKLADEDDATDGNVENTVDHKDVRHRRS